MLVRFFEQSDIFRFISLILLILLLLGKAFFIDFSNADELGWNWMALDVGMVWKIALSLFFVFLQSVLIFFMSNHFKLIKNDSILASTIYILLMGLFPSLTIYPEYYLVQIVFSILIFFLFVLDRDFYFESLFWASLWMGILVLVNYQLILLLPVLLIYLFVINRFSFRTLLISGIGFVFPYLVLLLYHFAQSKQLMYNVIDVYSIQFRVANLSDILLAVFLVIALLFSMMKVFSSLSRYMIKVRNYFILLSLLNFSFIILSFQNAPQYHIFIMLPLSFLIARMIESGTSSMWKDIYFLSLFLLAFSQELIHLAII